MADIHLEYSYPVRPERLFEALTRPDQLAAWWTTDCDVSMTIGGRSTFRFQEVWQTMRNEKVTPGTELEWLCVDGFMQGGPSEWIGTRIRFVLVPEAHGVRLVFDHAGYKDHDSCREHCHVAWSQFLNRSLRSLLATGKGEPFDSATDRNPEPAAK